MNYLTSIKIWCCVTNIPNTSAVNQTRGDCLIVAFKSPKCLLALWQCVTWRQWQFSHTNSHSVHPCSFWLVINELNKSSNSLTLYGAIVETVGHRHQFDWLEWHSIDFPSRYFTLYRLPVKDRSQECLGDIKNSRPVSERVHALSSLWVVRNGLACLFEYTLQLLVAAVVSWTSVDR